MEKPRWEVPFWNKSIEQLLRELGTTPAGLASLEAQRRLLGYGPNDAAVPKRSPGRVRLLARFRNPLVLILLFASALSALTGDFPSFVTVVTIIAASVVMDFAQEQRALNTVDALCEQVALRARTGAAPGFGALSEAEGYESGTMFEVADPRDGVRQKSG